MARSYTRYVTDELLTKCNPQNIELFEKFLNGKRSLRPKTKEAYISDFNQFLVYLLLNYNNKYILDFETDDLADVIDDYITFCIDTLHNNNRRIGRRISTLSSLFIYLRKKRKIKEIPTELVDRPKIITGQYVSEHIFLTDEQIALIREGLAKENNTQLSLYFEYALYTMSRINALCSVKVAQIDLEKKVIDGVEEKEGYICTFYISNRIRELITAWLKEREAIGIKSEFLFCTKTGGNAKAMIQELYTKKLEGFAGVSGITAHCLRRSGSSLRKRKGQSLESVSKLLNHRSTGVTQQFYIEQDYSKLQEESEIYEI